MYFLCTDGLSGLVTIHEIQEKLKPGVSEANLGELVNLANARGGDDNITALVCKVLES